MDGVALLVSLLMQDQVLAELVPADRIIGGPLPEAIELPAISVTSISRVDRHPVTGSGATLVRERVQISVFASGYDEVKAILSAVRTGRTSVRILPDSPLFALMPAATVHTDSSGPEFLIEEASIHGGSQDFAVMFTEAR